MTDPHQVAKDDLHQSLRSAREALLRTLEGVADEDARRAVGGVSLVGLIQSMATLEAAYLGQAFDNPFPPELLGSPQEQLGFPEEVLGAPEDLPRSEMHTPSGRAALADGSPESSTALYRQVWEHCDETVEALGLGSPGRVRSSPAEEPDVTLHGALVHLVAETHRHAGQAQMLRELLGP